MALGGGTSAATPAVCFARVLQLTHGRVYGLGGAAALLWPKPSTLQSKMKKLGIQRGSLS